MASPTHESKPNNIIIGIPEECLINGKTLLIEEYFELFVDGYHLSKPSHFIKHIHQLCLIDTQQQDQRSITSTHQLKSDHHTNELVKIIIEFPCECLKNGQNIKIETFNGIGEEKILGNFKDLYNQSEEKNNIQIKLANQSIEKGKTILIKKENIFITKTEDYENEQKHHFSNNQFTKRDHLQSNNLMEITIEVPPEFFHQGQTITLTNEDPELTEKNFPYHRNSKSD